MLEAFWLLAFFASHTRVDNEAFCWALHRDFLGQWTERDHIDYPSRQPKFEFHSLAKGDRNKFWERRARRMNDLLTSRY